MGNNDPGDVVSECYFPCLDMSTVYYTMPSPYECVLVEFSPAIEGVGVIPVIEVATVRGLCLGIYLAPS